MRPDAAARKSGRPMRRVKRPYAYCPSTARRSAGIATERRCAEVEQDGDDLGDRGAALAVEHAASEGEGRAADPHDACAHPHWRAVEELVPEVDLDAHDRDRVRAAADRVPEVGEQRDARGLKNPPMAALLQWPSGSRSANRTWSSIQWR